MTNTQLIILIAVLLIIYWYWQQQSALKSTDEPCPKFSPDTTEKPETKLLEEQGQPDPTSHLKIYQTAFEPVATPLSHKQKRQLKKKNRYD